MAELNVNILSPSKVVTKVKANQLQVPGSEGELGILPGHTAFVTELGMGELMVIGSHAKDESFFVSGGYLEVDRDQVTVLVDTVERPSDIDVERAERAKSRALKRLRSPDEGVDINRAQVALQRATVRLEVAGRSRIAK